MNSMQYLRDAMERRGMGVAHVAYKTGIPVSALENCLNGKRQMSLEEFIIVCNALDLAPTGFCARPGSPEWNSVPCEPADMDYAWYYIEDTEVIPVNKKATLTACLRRDKTLYLMLMPMFLLFLIYKYIPMFGLVIAFQDYKPLIGFANSEWIGLKNFQSFFSSMDALKLIRNTFLLNVYGLIFSFPCPILFALLLNELKSQRFKRIVQTISYLPHFLSTVVVVGVVQSFLSPMFGFVAQVFRLFGATPIDFMARPEAFRTIYIVSGIWQGMGWGSIVYLSAISGIDPALYEAAIVDGAGRFKQMIYITLPSISGVIIIMFIMTLGNILNVGFEKVLLMQNAFNYETSNVISTYVYKRGLVDMSYSCRTAVYLFNSLIGLVFVMSANWVSKHATGIGLW